ncbi:hypothetical protein IL306_012166 [Fusarium sp. DS 682]|nr:hypothetical protein IL306_012166 [Fusarium sp. DS 682]
MAEQARLQATKENFQSAFDEAVNSKEQAESRFKKDQDRGLADNQNFDSWWPVNAPAYAAAQQNYQAARAQYEAALQSSGQDGYNAWMEKVKKAAMDNMGPHGPNYNVLVGPN